MSIYKTRPTPCLPCYDLTPIVTIETVPHIFQQLTSYYFTQLPITYSSTSQKRPQEIYEASCHAKQKSNKQDQTQRLKTRKKEHETRLFNIKSKKKECATPVEGK